MQIYIQELLQAKSFAHCLICHVGIPLAYCSIWFGDQAYGKPKIFLGFVPTYL